MFPCEKGGQTGRAGSGKRSKQDYMGISLPQDVVLILPFPCSLCPASQFMKGPKLNIQDVIATWRPRFSFQRLWAPRGEGEDHKLKRGNANCECPCEQCRLHSRVWPSYWTPDPRAPGDMPPALQRPDSWEVMGSGLHHSRLTPCNAIRRFSSSPPHQ